MTSQTERYAQTSQQIFAIRNSKDFGQRMASKIKEWGKVSSGGAFALHYANVGIAYTHLYGLDVEGVGANAAVVTRSGEQGSIAELRIPGAAGDLRKVWNVIVGPELSWKAIAANTDYASGARAITAKNALEYYWTERDVSTLSKGVAFESLAFGEAAMHIPWNEDLGEDIAIEPMVDEKTGEPLLDEEGKQRIRIIRTGDIDYRPISTWDIIRDPSAKSFESLPYRIVREWQNRFDVAARCRDPETALAALTAAYQPTEVYQFWRPFVTASSAQMLSDLIPVYYLYHLRTGSVVEGRQTEFLDNGAIIHDGPLDEAYWKHLPVVRMAPDEYRGTPFPYTKFFATLGCEQAEDGLARDLLTNATATSGGLVAAEDDSNTPPLQLGGGPKVIYFPKGAKKPEPLVLQQSHPEHFKLKQTLAGDRRSILGLDRLTAGEEIGATWSGAMAALVTSTTVQNNSQEQAAWGKFVQKTGNVTIAHIRYHMKQERQIALAGKSFADLVTTTKLGSERVAGIDRMQVQLAPALQQTDAGKMELGTTALKQGWAKTPQQLQSVFDTGRLDALLEDGTKQLMLIKDENEALARGEDVEVMLSDDHILHLREHGAVTASVLARQDPKVVAAKQRHDAKHIEILKNPGLSSILQQVFNQPSLAAPAGPAKEEMQPATKLGAANLAVKSGFAQTPEAAQKVLETGKLDAGAPPPGQGLTPHTAPGVSPAAAARTAANPTAAANPAPGQGPTPPERQQAQAPTLPKNPQTGRPAGPVAGTVPAPLAIRPG